MTMILIVAVLMMMITFIHCYSSSSSTLRLSSVTMNNIKLKGHSNGLYKINRDVLKMKVNDNELSSSSSSSSINNIIEKASLITVTSILLLPAIAYSADSEAISAIQIARPVFDIFVNLLSFLFICRTVISWYPKTDLNAFPYNIAAWPTEPLLAPVRDLVPPAFGVDVSSIVWVAVLSFLREILLGQQGILTLIERNG